MGQPRGPHPVLQKVLMDQQKDDCQDKHAEANQHRSIDINLCRHAERRHRRHGRKRHSIIAAKCPRPDRPAPNKLRQQAQVRPVCTDRQKLKQKRLMGENAGQQNQYQAGKPVVQQFRGDMEPPAAVGEQKPKTGDKKRAGHPGIIRVGQGGIGRKNAAQRDYKPGGIQRQARRVGVGVCSCGGQKKFIRASHRRFFLEAP